jgi:CPA2 family monovalent cation:H+ antiporter-2
MGNYGTFLQDLAMVLCVAAVITVIFQRLHQPVILGYLLAGLILGPYVPVPLFANVETVKTLSELGVILVMFSIGLEFSIRRLARMLPTAGLTTLIEMSVMGWLGFIAGHLMGWTNLESLFAGAILSFSSTMIAAKTLTENSQNEALNRMVIGVLVVQDVAAVLVLAVLTPLAQGAHLSLMALSMTTGSLIGFLAVLFGSGFLLIPRLIRFVVGLNNPETLLVAVVGICFAMALLAQKGGYSVALGAFLAGMLVAESGATHSIERLIHPLRDMFSAVFFVSVGMLVDPSVLLKHWAAVLLLTLLVTVGQIASVSLGVFLTGRPLKTALQAGMSLAQIGEFSFIIARMGVDRGVIGEFVYDTAVAVSVVTAFLTPWLIRSSVPFSKWVDRHLPVPLQTFTSLYGSWLEELKSEKQEQTLFQRSRRIVGFLALDTLSLVVITITTAASVKRWSPQIQSFLGLPSGWGPFFLILAGCLVAIPFLIGVLGRAKSLGGILAAAAIPTAEPDKVDFGLAPRKVLTVTFQVGVIFGVGLPLMSLTQPFLPFGYSPAVFLGVLTLIGVVFWKSALNLQDHVHAGAQMVADALAHHAPERSEALLTQVNTMVPGIGAPTSVRLSPECQAVSKTLAELNLRITTGASIIAILRGEERILMPAGNEVLRAGDGVVLVGTQDSIRSAKDILQKPRP